MTKKYRIICAMFFAFLFLQSACAQFREEPSWQDEFEIDGAPNALMWKRAVKAPKKQLAALCDNDSCAYIKDGYLHLRISKTNDSVYPYQSGRLISRQPYLFNKGKVVVRAKAPISAGTWPAIWFSGNNTDKGYHVELDLMEHIKAMGDSCYKGVYHLWGNFGGKKKNHKSWGQKVTADVNKWHVYTLEVLEGSIVMKVDEQTVYTITKGEHGDEWPSEQEFSVRLSLNYGGYGAKKTGIDDSALPQEMLVDYVRFYQLENN